MPRMAMPSVMPGSSRFARAPQAEIERSTFDRSHGLKTTLAAAGKLYPIYWDEALPGDTFNLQLSALLRLTTPLKPLMDNLYVDFHFFAVPYRLVWANWQKFNGEQDNPGDSTSYVIPTIAAVTPTSGSLYDYFGIPCGTTVGGNIQNISALHFRAYNLIWNKWYRDENLQNGITVNTGDGPDANNIYFVMDRGKRHDYFTSCLPWPQKGTAVALPLGTSASVVRATSSSAPTFHKPGGDTPTATLQMASTGTPTATLQAQTSAAWAVGDALQWLNTGLIADLSTATAATINQLRQAFQIQKLLERDARGGTRYTEIIKAHFGVTSDDARLQRPEYLGGGTCPIVISPVTQNSASNTQPTPQGNLTAIGTGMVHGVGFTKSFTEHCLLIGICSVRADLTYQQGLERMWSRSTRYDFYWPALAHIGEQAVLNKEIYCIGGVSGQDEAVFGYQERYAEYRYKQSKITGMFRSDLAAPLDIWHLSQEFSALPVLGSTFIKENPPLDRVVAVTTEPKFYYDSYIKLICARPMPVFGVPGFIDHF